MVFHLLKVTLLHGFIVGMRLLAIFSDWLVLQQEKICLEAVLYPFFKTCLLILERTLQLRSFTVADVTESSFILKWEMLSHSLKNTKFYCKVLDQQSLIHIKVPCNKTFCLVTSLLSGRRYGTTLYMDDADGTGNPVHNCSVVTKGLLISVNKRAK